MKIPFLSMKSLRGFAWIFSVYFLIPICCSQPCFPFYTQTERIRLWHCERQHPHKRGWDRRCIWYVENSCSTSGAHGWGIITKCHGVGGSNNRNGCSHSCGGCKCKVKVLAVLVSPERPLSWPGVLPWPFLHARLYMPGASSFPWTPVLLLQACTFVTSFFGLWLHSTLITSLKGAFAKYSHILSFGS